MLVTSFSPTRIEAQQKALESWKQFNQEIVAIQCMGEDYAKDFITNIIWVKPNLHWSKRTPSLVDVFKQINQPATLINSDIETEPHAFDDWTPKERKLSVGLRIDYCKKFTQLNKYGLDVFLLTPEMVQELTNSAWALGIPGWDYWVTWKLLLSGYELDIHKTGFLHAAHHEQWNKDDYRRCSKLLEFEFDIPVQDISDSLQTLTGRKNLVKKVYSE